MENGVLFVNMTSVHYESIYVVLCKVLSIFVPFPNVILLVVIYPRKYGHNMMTRLIIKLFFLLKKKDLLINKPSFLYMCLLPIRTRKITYEHY